MSEQDDWGAFVAMMEREGWKQSSRKHFEWCDRPAIKGNIEYNRSRLIILYNAETGRYLPNRGKESNVGTWREWLAAGTSPTPF